MFQVVRRSVLKASPKSPLRAFSQFAADKFEYKFNEKEGNDHALNWSLNGNDVTPYNNAYQNLPVEKLSSFVDKIAINGNACTIGEVDVDVDYYAYEELYAEVTEHLSHAENIFVEDASVASYANDRARVRVISDSPISNVAARNLLVRVPKKDSLGDAPIVVYIASTGSYANVKKVEGQLYFEEDDDKVSAKLIFAGMPTVSDFVNGIAQAKNQLNQIEESSSCVLPCDTYVYDNEKTALVFNSSEAQRQKALENGSLYAAHYSSWNEDGVTNVFNGAIVKKSSHQNSVDCNEGKVVPHPGFNLRNAPAVIAIVGKKSGAIEVSELEDIFPTCDIEKLSVLIEKNGTKVVSVAKESEIPALLK